MRKCLERLLASVLIGSLLSPAALQAQSENIPRNFSLVPYDTNSRAEDLFRFPEPLSGPEDLEKPLYKFEHKGESISLYRTDRPGFYKDQKGNDWLYTKNPDPETKLHFHKFTADAFKEFVKGKILLDPTDVSHVYKDHRGERWIRIETESRNEASNAIYQEEIVNGQKKLFHFIRIEHASAEEIFRAFGGGGGVGGTSIFPGIQSFSKELLRFSAAIMVVQLATCFGGGMMDWTIRSHSYNPVCMDEFLGHLIDPVGWAAFYFFMIGARVTNNGLMQVALISAKHVGAKDSIPALRQKIAPLTGYLGMAGGALLSQVVTHFLTAPTWGQCMSLMLVEGPGSIPCQQAATHFLSIEGFWDDFIGGSISLISSSIAALYTQQLLAKSVKKGPQAIVSQLKAFRLVAGDRKAYQAVERAGLSMVKAIRVGTSLVSATGVPGFVIFVTTQIGHFVLFLAWDEILKYPIIRQYHDLSKSRSVKKGMALIDEVLEESARTNWQVPLVKKYTSCHSVYSEYGAPVDAQETCSDNWESPLVVGLDLAKTGAIAYRQKVLLDSFDQVDKKWQAKVKKYMDKYRASKMILEHVYREREKINGSAALNLYLTGYVTARAWDASLRIDLANVNNAFTTELRQHLERLTKLTKATNQQLFPDEDLEIPDTFLEKVKDPKLKEEFKKAQEELARRKKENAEPRQVVRGLKPLTPEELKVSKEAESYAAEAKRANNKNLILDAELRKALTDFQNFITQKVAQASAPQVHNCTRTPIVCEATAFMRKFKVSAIPDNQVTTMLPGTTDFMQVLVGIFQEAPVSTALFEMLCGDRDTFRLSHITFDGMGATFENPTLILPEHEDSFRLNNCADNLGTPIHEKGSFHYTDFWYANDRIYSDAFALLADPATPLRSGKTREEAKLWWHKNVYTSTSRFMRDSMLAYQNLLNEYLFSQIPDVSPEELVRQSSAVMRGGELYYPVVSLQLAERPLIAYSLMGQANQMLDIIEQSAQPAVISSHFFRLKMAITRHFMRSDLKPQVDIQMKEWDSIADKTGGDFSQILRIQTDLFARLRTLVPRSERFNGVEREWALKAAEVTEANMKQKIRALRLAIARYILGLRHPVEASRITTEWERLENDVTSAGSRMSDVDKANAAFFERIREVSLSKEKVQKTKVLHQHMSALNKELYELLTATRFDSLSGTEAAAFSKGYPPESLSKLSKDTYKKFIFYKFQHEYITSLGMEISKLYNKLGSKPLTGTD